MPSLVAVAAASGREGAGRRKAPEARPSDSRTALVAVLRPLWPTKRARTLPCAAPRAVPGCASRSFAVRSTRCMRGTLVRVATHRVPSARDVLAAAAAAAAMGLLLPGPPRWAACACGSAAQRRSSNVAADRMASLRPIATDRTKRTSAATVGRESRQRRGEGPPHRRRHHVLCCAHCRRPVCREAAAVGANNRPNAHPIGAQGRCSKQSPIAPMPRPR
eukprot:354837-Chlamydomonas_euryale.AAC.8